MDNIAIRALLYSRAIPEIMDGDEWEFYSDLVVNGELFAIIKRKKDGWQVAPRAPGPIHIVDLITIKSGYMDTRAREGWATAFSYT